VEKESRDDAQQGDGMLPGPAEDIDMDQSLSRQRRGQPNCPPIPDVFDGLKPMVNKKKTRHHL
jgi:hypothetical protein